MARSFTSANTCSAVTSIRILVYDDISAWKDLCSLDGYSRVRSFSANWGTSTGRLEITCQVINTDDYRTSGLSLDPSDPTSTYNVCGSSGTDPLLGGYHPVEIYMTKSGGSEQMMFTGFVGQSNIEPIENVTKADIFPVTFVGEMQPYVDHWIVKEESLVYSGNYLSIGTARDVLSQIQYDYGHEPNIVIEDTDLNYYVNKYQISDTSLYDAIKKPVNAIGYMLIEKYSEKLSFDAGSTEFTAGETVTSSGGGVGKVISWVVTSGTWSGNAKGTLYIKDSTGSFADGQTLTGSVSGSATADSSIDKSFRIAVVDPDRTNTTPDIDLGTNVRMTKLTYSEANVRTWVQVWYKDRTTGKLANVISYSDTAKASYGIPDGRGGRLHKKMRISEESGSWIDTRGEAQLEADYALSDVSKPWPDAEVNIPWLVLGLEPGDLLRFDTDTSTDMDISVSEIIWNFDANNTYGTTTVRGTLEGRVGDVTYWFNNSRTDFVGSLISSYKEMTAPTPIAPDNLNVESVFSDMSDGSLAPVLHATWSGTRDWSMTSYRLETMLAESLLDGTTTAGGTTSTVVDSTQSWPEFLLIDRYIYIPTSTRGGDDQIRRIIYNDGTTIRVDVEFDTAPSAGETYYILDPISEWTAKYATRRPVLQVEGLPGGKYIIARVATTPRGYEL